MSIFAAKVLLHMSNDKSSDYKKRLSEELSNSVLREDVWAQMASNGMDPMAGMNPMVGMVPAPDASSVFVQEGMYAGPPSVHSAGSRFTNYHAGYDQVSLMLLSF